MVLKVAEFRLIISATYMINLWLLCLSVAARSTATQRQPYRSFQDFPKDKRLKSCVRLIRTEEKPLFISSQACLSLGVKMCYSNLKKLYTNVAIFKSQNFPETLFWRCS